MADGEKKLVPLLSPFQKVDKKHVTNQLELNPEIKEHSVEKNDCVNSSKSNSMKPDLDEKRECHVVNDYFSSNRLNPTSRQEKVKAIAVVTPMKIEKEEKNQDESEEYEEYEEEYIEDADDESNKNNKNSSNHTRSAFTVVIPKTSYPIDVLSSRNKYAHLINFPPPTTYRVHPQIVQQGGVRAPTYFEPLSDSNSYESTSNNYSGNKTAMPFFHPAHFKNLFQENSMNEKRSLKRGLNNDETVDGKRQKKESLNLEGTSGEEEETDSASEQ